MQYLHFSLSPFAIRYSLFVIRYIGFLSSSRQIQTQVQTQVQTLSPQQLLVVKLIELPTVELEDRVRAEILENPALEEGPEEQTGNEIEESEATVDDADDTGYDLRDDYRDEDDIPDYRLRQDNRSRDDVAEEIPFSDVTSFYETLRVQLAELSLSEHQRQLADYLIGSLDDDGLLRKPIAHIVDELALYGGVEATEAEVEEALSVIQSFDPPGLGGRDLRECLLLQLQRKLSGERSDDEQTAARQQALLIVRDAYDDFTRKNYDRVGSRLGISREQVQAAVKEICKLNPRPGASLGEAIGRNMQQIVPDFLLDVDEAGRLHISLNDRGVPEMRVSPSFIALIDSQSRAEGQSRQQREAALFLKQKIDAARGFIEAVKQRQATLLSTMQAIADIQHEFFIEGDETLLKPMILKDVATRTGLAISTVSRVSNSKYVRTRFGTYALKFFFNDGYVNDEGEEMSVRKLTAALRRIIEEEDKSNPLTDDEIVNLMNERGFPMARRTVAKYRQQLGIPVARLRR